MSTQLAERPSHVPAALVADVDYFNLPGMREDVHLAWKRLQDGPPIIWTPRHGGHWIATRGADIKAIQLDHETFSMAQATIPPGAAPAIPVESDPPAHTGYRAIISPLFTPDVLKRVQGDARALSQSLIARLAPEGRCEFMGDFARHLPIAMFLMLVDLPFDDRHFLMAQADIRFRSSDPAKRDAAKVAIIDYLQVVIEARRAQPGADFISRIVNARIGDRPVTDAEMQNLLATVMSGGLDTVASMMGFIMRFLALNPAHRRRLIAEPAKIPAAVDEFIRRHGVANTARVVTHDTQFRGVSLRAGDRILAPNNLYGLDDAMFDDALAVDFDRADAGRHASFGNGPHRCPGANLARLEIRLLLEEWLPAIPDFTLDPDNPPLMATGIGNSIISLPLLWKAGGTDPSLN